MKLFFILIKRNFFAITTWRKNILVLGSSFFCGDVEAGIVSAAAQYRTAQHVVRSIYFEM
jgi:hypothetical protein